MKKLILSLLISISNLYALESTDILSANILKVYNKNIIVLDRGAEDDVEVNDHIKITNKDGFIARGLCIKRGMKSSHHKIYRVVKPELVSKDTTFTLTSINSSELPKDIERKFKRVNFSDKFKDWNENDLEKQLKLQQKRFVTYDLPTDLAKAPKIDEENTSDNDFINKNFSKDQFVKDFDRLYVSIFASPFAVESLNNQRDLNYGIQILNKGKKYDFSTSFTNFNRKSVDAFTKEQVSRSRKELWSIFEIKDFSSRLNYFSMLRYEDSYYGDIANPRSHTQLGLLGFKFITNYVDKDNLTDFSYVLFLDFREDDVMTTGVKDTQKFSLIRHGFRFRFRRQLNKTLSLNNEFWWQPAMNISNFSMDFADHDAYNQLRFSIKATKKLYVDFENHYSSDINQQRLYKIDSVVIKNIVNLRYQFEI